MKRYEFEFNAVDGLKLRGQGWVPEDCKAILYLLHGHGEHSNRYSHVGEHFADSGYGLLAIDLRGHGRSEGPRGHTPSYDLLMDDIAGFVAYGEERYPDVPAIIYGHSMGGNLALNYALRRDPRVSGVIATSPWLKLAFQPPAFKVAIAKTMNILCPTLSQRSGLEVPALSRDEQLLKQYREDPMAHDRITARLFVAIYQSGLWALAHASGISVPSLVMHGTGDRICSALASKLFAEAAGTNCELKLWEGLYHELHNEPERKQVLDYISGWLELRDPWPQKA